MADYTKTLKMWQQAASATPECLSLEVLEQMVEGAPANTKAAAHLANCAHCQTELSMLKSFVSSVPSPNEGAAVAWIATQLQRQQVSSSAKQPARRASFWQSFFRLPYLAGAATLAIVATLGVSLYHSAHSGYPPKISDGSSIGVYRGGLHLLAPIGDLDQAPQTLRWEAYPGAASYKVELTDAAKNVLASATSTQATLTVTPEMKSNMHPGKPLEWKVTALDASGRAIADSSGGHFKIK
jgi:hypothetical protein